MRATIEQSEKTTGLLRKTTHYLVTCKVEFSEEEKAIIKQRKLGDAIVLSTPIPPDSPAAKHGMTEWNLRISSLLKEPHVHQARTPSDANAYEQRITQALQDMKAFIEENASTRQGARTIEL